MISFEKTLTSDAKAISALALRSKAHWGYDQKFMQACVDELSYSPENITQPKTCYITLKHHIEILGFYKLDNIGSNDVLLEALFIEPNEIGKGYGKALFEHAKENTIKFGGKQLLLQSDPNAEGFYQAQGMLVIGEEESESIPGRFLKTFSLNVT